MSHIALAPTGAHLGNRIGWLNQYLNFIDDNGDDNGNPLRFRSHMLRDTFAVEMLLAGVSIENVSKLMGHKSVRTTEKYYAPRVKRRTLQLEDELVAAMRKMGATVTTPGPCLYHPPRTGSVVTSARARRAEHLAVDSTSPVRGRPDAILFAA